MWEVIGERVPHETESTYRYPCRCECGTESLVLQRNLQRKESLSCSSCKTLSYAPHADVLGKVIGDWTVLEYAGLASKGFRLYKCVSACGVIRLIKGSLLRANMAPQCKECKAVRSRKTLRNTLWNRICYHAAARDLPVNLTQDRAWELFEEQGRKCALSGVDLTVAENFAENRSGKTTASLDRIDSSLGYFEENVQWVHKKLNVIKMDLSQADFIEWCHKVSDFSRNIKP